MTFYGTHPFVPMVGDDGRPLEYCERCGSHRAAHEPPPAPAKRPPRPGPEATPELTRQTGPLRAPDGVVVFTMAHIAALSGLDVQTVRAYRSKGSLPRADGRVGNVPYWYRDTILPWILKPRRPKGNPGWHKGMPGPGPRGKRPDAPVGPPDV